MALPAFGVSSIVIDVQDPKIFMCPLGHLNPSGSMFVEQYNYVIYPHVIEDRRPEGPGHYLSPTAIS